MTDKHVFMKIEDLICKQIKNVCYTICQDLSPTLLEVIHIFTITFPTKYVKVKL